MHAPRPISRAVAGVLMLSLLAAGGCSWFRKGGGVYAQSPENRPLEVPPELDRSRAVAANEAPGGTSVTASQNRPAASAPAAESAVGFNLPGTRDAAFERVGQALAAVPGLTVASRAQLLGAFDVSYEGSSFLVRVSAVEAGAYVSAVDPRGLPAPGEAPRKLMSQLQAALATR